VLHTLVVVRSIGGHRPVEPRAVLSEALDLTYMRTDETEFEQEVENRVCDFCGLFERGLANCGKAQLVCSFYTTQSRKQSIWNMLVGSDDKIVFEQWRVPVFVEPMRRYDTAAENLKGEAHAQASAGEQVRKALRFVIEKANAKVDHLPPPPQTQAAYRFDVTFASMDGRSLYAGGGSAGMVAGSNIGAAAARIGSSLTSTMKHTPYFT